MPEPMDSLIEAVEREQTALAALVQANLDAEIEDSAEQMIARHGALVPVMRRLGEATNRLVLACITEGVSPDLAAKIEAWRREIAALLAALRERADDFAARRTLIAEALGRLSHASQAMQGYRPAKRGGATYIQKQA